MATFKPRLTKPEAGNKYYNTKANGGYSYAIKGSPTDAGCDVLSNCVGYAYGRFNEIGGYGYCKYLSPVNAENFIQYANGLTVGQTPRLGACMVWQRGATLYGSDGAGHVAIVEQINSPTEIVTSESGWNASRPFWTQTRQKGNGNWGESSAYKFLGFIYNPAVSDDVTTSDNGLPEIGEHRYFGGTKHYVSANALFGKSCKPGEVEVIGLYPSGKHPVQVRYVSGGGSTAYGWVNLSDLQNGSAGFVEGDKVMLNNGATKYSNGVGIPTFIRRSTLYVRAVERNGEILLVSTEPIKKVYTGRVKASDVHKI